MRSVIFSLIKTEEIIRSLSCKNPFCAIVKGLRFFLSQRRTNPYGVLHRKRHTRRSFIRSFCVCPCGAIDRNWTFFSVSCILFAFKEFLYALSKSPSICCAFHIKGLCCRKFTDFLSASFLTFEKQNITSNFEKIEALKK